MNHYWVRFDRGIYGRHTAYVNAANQEDAINEAVGCYSWLRGDYKVVSVRIDRNYEHRQYWRAAWERALNGLPDLPQGRGWGHLARLLGYKMYSTPRDPKTKPYYIGHTYTYCNLHRGSKPKNPWRAAKLLELADML